MSRSRGPKVYSCGWYRHLDAENERYREQQKLEFAREVNRQQEEEEHMLSLGYRKHSEDVFVYEGLEKQKEFDVYPLQDTHPEEQWYVENLGYMIRNHREVVEKILSEIKGER